MAGVEERVVVVTGSGRGIGAGHAEYLARTGARVVVNDIGADLHGEGRDLSPAQEVVQRIRDAGGIAITNGDSVATPEGANAIVEAALAEFGRIDAVVNNAGILRDVTLANMTDEQWDAVLRIHLYGTFLVTRAAWPHFKRQEHGRVVATTSTAGLYGNFGQANYAAAKMGVVGFIKSLALEGAKYNIKCNAISPGGATRMTTGLGKDEPGRAERLARLDPMWAAPAVTYFCSDECEDSGTIVRASGGRFRRIEVAQSSGVEFEKIPDYEEFVSRWHEIVDMEKHDFSGGVGKS